MMQTGPDARRSADPTLASEPSAAPYDEAAAAPALGARSLRGAVWVTVCSLGNKVFSLVGQIALAWLLVPDEIGLVALALSVTSFFEWLTAGGLQDVLIQRRATFDRDAGQVLYLSVAANVVAALLAISAAPIGALIFNDPRVVPLIVVAAAAWPLGPWGVMHRARLTIDLRFGTQAAIFFGIGLIRMGGAVVLAWLGFGAYSLLVPIYFSHLFYAIISRVAAGRIRTGQPRPSAWLALLAPAAWLMLYGLLIQVRLNGTSMVVGILHDASVTGLYYWGFLLSGQTVGLLAGNLREVLFPALARLSDAPHRQYEGFVAACRFGFLLAIPLCLVQALTAPQLIRLLFAEHWWQAGPVVVWLSLGLITQPFNVLAEALLRARGAFRLLSLLVAAQVASLLIASVIGATLGRESSVALWAGCSEFLAAIAAGLIAFRQFGRGWREQVAAVAPLLAVGAIAGLAAWGAVEWARRTVAVGDGTVSLLVQVAVAVAACIGVYAGLVALALPDRAKEFRVRVRSVLGKEP
jgi:O-antigen/teichoic acid export membrane protein